MTRAIRTMTAAQEAAWLEEMAATVPVPTARDWVTLALDRMEPDREYTNTEIAALVPDCPSRRNLASHLFTYGHVERIGLAPGDPRRRQGGRQYVYRKRHGHSGQADAPTA